MEEEKSENKKLFTAIGLKANTVKSTIANKNVSKKLKDLLGNL